MTTGSIPTPTPARLAANARERLEATLEHFNGSHADTVLLLARYHGDAPAATDAEAVDVDTAGVEIRLMIDGAVSTTRLPFTAPVATAEEVQGQVMGMIAAAREAVGEAEPLTSLERELETVPTLATYRTTVAEVDELSPNLRRIVVRGGLDGWVPLGADDFALLFVPRWPGDETIGNGFSMAAWQGMPEDDRPPAAYYTIRQFDSRDGGSIELWAVLHDHEGGVGGWATRAEPGDTVALWGPRSSFHPPAVPHGGRSDHYLFVADESGFAAVGAILDRLNRLDPRVEVTVLAETVDADHEITISDRPGTDIRWLHRGQAEPGLSEGFVGHIRALDLDPTTTIAFGAAESRQITAVRKHLRHKLGMPPDRVFMTGYWRR